MTFKCAGCANRADGSFGFAHPITNIHTTAIALIVLKMLRVLAVDKVYEREQ